MSKTLFTYFIIFLLLIPIFGINLILNLIGNIFLIIFLLPILIFIIGLLVFNNLKKNSQTCTNCGLATFGTNENCIYCGNALSDNKIKIEVSNTPSDEVIEVDAEEIK